MNGWCEKCGEDHTTAAACHADDWDMEYDPNASDCPGHEWAYTGTQYGGDDLSYYGEGRCYCIHCGADGDA